MKRLFLLMLSLMLSYVVYADEIEVPMSPIPEGQIGQDNRSLPQLPSVSYEDNEVYVYTPYNIESMEIIIYDATGEVIYTYISAMLPGRNTIILPPMVSESKYCIMLNFNGYHLLGYF